MRPYRSLVLLAALSCASVLSLSAVESTPPPASLTDQVKQSITNEVTAQLKAELPGLVSQTKEAVNQAKDAYSTPSAVQVPTAPPVQPTTPTAGTRVANVGADVLETLVLKAKSYGGKLEDGLTKAVDYGMAELPGLIKEWLTWQWWKHAIWIIIPIIFFIILLPFSVWCGKTCTTWERSYHTSFKEIACIVGGVLTAVCVLVLVVNLNHLLACIQIQIAPRIYIFESLSQLVR